MNNVRWAWHSLIMADVVFHTFYTRKTSSVCPLITAKVVPLQWISHFWNIHDVLPFTYQTHDLIVVVQTETFQRHTDWAQTNKPRGEKKKTQKKKTEKDKERREKTHQLSIWRMTSFVPSLSFLSHLLGWTESPLSPSLGWLLHSSPWRHLFPLSLSRSSFSLSLFLSVAAIFLKLYELVTTPFFFPHLLSYFLISAWTWIQHLPLDKLSVSLSICLSTANPPPPPLFSPIPASPPHPLGKIQDEIEKKKKKLYRDIFFQEKS